MACPMIRTYGFACWTRARTRGGALMRKQQRPDETVVSTALALAQMYLVEEQRGLGLGDRLKVMKTLFLASYDLFGKRAKGMDFVFYRWTWGPMSNQVYDAWSLLKQAGLLEEEEEFYLTRRGRTIAAEFVSDLLTHSEENMFFRETMSWVAERVANAPTGRVLELVYRMKARPVDSNVAQPIRNIEKGQNLTLVLEESEASTVFQMDFGWGETFSLLLDPSALASLSRAEEDFRAGRYAEQVFI